MTECRAEVDAILRSRETGGYRVPQRELIQRLAALPRECSDAMRATARELLTRLPKTNEADFAAALEALVLLKDPQIAELATAAIRNPYALVKEDYVSILEDIGELDRAVEALVDVLDNGSTGSDRRELTTTIRSLHALQVEEALASVARYVSHRDVAVRGSAAMFMYDFDNNGSLGSAVFAEQLRREKDTDMLELLIDGLRRWNVQPEPAILARLASESSTPPSLRESVRAAQAMDGPG